MVQRMTVAGMSALELVESGGRDMNDSRARRRDSFMESPDAVLKLLKPLLAEWQINAIVHSVAGYDEVGLGLFQYPSQALMQVGPGKLSTGMAGFGKAGDRLARQAQVQKLYLPIRKAACVIRLDKFHVLARVSDAVAKQDDTVNLLQC